MRLPRRCQYADTVAVMMGQHAHWDNMTDAGNCKGWGEHRMDRGRGGRGARFLFLTSTVRHAVNHKISGEGGKNGCHNGRIDVSIDSCNKKFTRLGSTTHPIPSGWRRPA